MVAFFFGIATALFWGIGDFLVRGVSARLGTIGTIFWSHLLMLVLVAGVGLIIGLGTPAPTPAQWGLGLVGAVLNLMMVATVYRALHHGPLTVVAPIIASYSGVTTIIAVATGTDTLGGWPAMCLGIIFLGVLLAAIKRGGGGGAANKGIAWAVASTFCSGLLSWAQGVAIIPAVGAVRAVLINAAFVLITTGWYALRTKRPAGERLFDAQLLALGACMAAGFLAFAMGLGSGQIVLVSVLASMCGAVTALLGALVAKQPATKLQWCGGR